MNEKELVGVISAFLLERMRPSVVEPGGTVLAKRYGPLLQAVCGLDGGEITWLSERALVCQLVCQLPKMVEGQCHWQVGDRIVYSASECPHLPKASPRDVSQIDINKMRTDDPNTPENTFTMVDYSQMKESPPQPHYLVDGKCLSGEDYTPKPDEKIANVFSDLSESGV